MQRPDADLVREFMERNGVRRIPPGVSQREFFERLPQSVRSSPCKWSVAKRLKPMIEKAFPLQKGA